MTTTAPTGHATSAIPGMTVAEIRRALSKLRDIWANATPESPLFICDKLHKDKSIAEFSKEFVFGHHLKRHFKSVMQASLNNKHAHELAAARAAALKQTAQYNSTSAEKVVLASPSQSSSAPPTTAVPGPKGDMHDPFPFTAAWQPKTQRGKRAFAAIAPTTPPPPSACPVADEVPTPPEKMTRVQPRRKCRPGSLADLC